MRWVRRDGLTIAAAVAGALLLFLGWRNRRPVPVDFYWWRLEVPVWLVIVLACVLGILMATAVGWLRQQRLGREIRRKQARIDTLEQELVALRNLPLARPARGQSVVTAKAVENGRATVVVTPAVDSLPTAASPRALTSDRT